VVSKHHRIIELTVVLIPHCWHMQLLANPGAAIPCSILSVWLLESLVAILAEATLGNLLRLTQGDKTGRLLSLCLRGRTLRIDISIEIAMVRHSMLLLLGLRKEQRHFEVCINSGFLELTLDLQLVSLHVLL
jgi:hypothetical protein